MNMLILYYSMYGHTFALCDAAAEGARQVPGTVVTMRRVPETLPADLLEKLGATEAARSFRQDPIANVMELADYDAVIFGTPTRFGNMCGQMRSFLDGSGPLWGSNALVVKVASVMTSSATQHGGQESTVLTSTIAGSGNERKPTANELEGALFQGRHVAMIGSRLAKVG